MLNVKLQDIIFWFQIYFDTAMNNMPGLYLEMLSINAKNNTH